jgi:hypothetical protein
VLSDRTDFYFGKFAEGWLHCQFQCVHACEQEKGEVRHETMDIQE